MQTYTGVVFVKLDAS